MAADTVHIIRVWHAGNASARAVNTDNAGLDHRVDGRPVVTKLREYGAGVFTDVRAVAQPIAGCGARLAGDHGHRAGPQPGLRHQRQDDADRDRLLLVDQRRTTSGRGRARRAGG